MAKQLPGEPYTRITSDEAHEMLEEGNAVAIDVRREDEYLAGHIKGATWIPVDDVIARFDEIPTEGNLLFICAVGARSGLACESAAAMGADSKRLFNIEDGTPTWIEKKLPTSYGRDK